MKPKIFGDVEGRDQQEELDEDEQYVRDTEHIDSDDEEYVDDSFGDEWNGDDYTGAYDPSEVDEDNR